MNLSSAKQLVSTPTKHSAAKVSSLISSVMRMFDANARQVLGHTKNRGDVSGGGKKPWKQKGTGRARAGSTRSPLWRKGGTAHGPRNTRNYTLTLPDKVKQSALGTALLLKAQTDALFSLDSLPTDGKTKLLKELNDGTTLLVLTEANQSIWRASRNLQKLQAKLVTAVNAKNVLQSGRVVGTEAALKALITHAGLTTAKPATEKKAN